MSIRATRPITRVAALTAAVALPLAGCAAGSRVGGEQSADQAVAAQTRAASQGQLADTALGSMFQGLPKPRDVVVDGTATVTPQEVTQSYTVKGTSPGAVLRFYTDHLDGWTLSGPAPDQGSDASHGTWDKNQYELTVSAQRIDAETVQLDLQLDDQNAQP